MPSSFVFAFGGFSLETCKKHILDFYKENPTPINRVPRGIIVNGKYAIFHYPYEGATIHRWDSDFIEANLQAMNCETGAEGWPLFLMLVEINKGLSWLDGMYVDYGPYFTEANKS